MLIGEASRFGVEGIPHGDGRIHRICLGEALLPFVLDIVGKQGLEHARQVVGQAANLDHRVFTKFRFAGRLRRSPLIEVFI